MAIGGINSLITLLLLSGLIMASRYATIKRAAQLTESLRNLQIYENTIRPRKVNSRGAREPSKNAYVTPFGTDILTTEVVRVRTSVPGYTALATLINMPDNQAEVADTLGAKEIRTVGGFRPARIIWFRNATRSVITKKSDVTKDDYLKYDGDRDTCPFGRKVIADNQYDAFNAIKTAVLGSNAGLAVNRVSLTPERIRYNA